MRRLRSIPTRAVAGVSTANGRPRVVIDDTLATTAVFDMKLTEIQGDASDAEGLRIGDEVGEAILAELDRQEHADGRNMAVTRNRLLRRDPDGPQELGHRPACAIQA